MKLQSLFASCALALTFAPGLCAQDPGLRQQIRQIVREEIKRALADIHVQQDAANKKKAHAKKLAAERAARDKKRAAQKKATAKKRTVERKAKADATQRYVFQTKRGTGKAYAVELDTGQANKALARARKALLDARRAISKVQLPAKERRAVMDALNQAQRALNQRATRSKQPTPMVQLQEVHVPKIQMPTLQPVQVRIPKVDFPKVEVKVLTPDDLHKVYRIETKVGKDVWLWNVEVPPAEVKVYSLTPESKKAKKAKKKPKKKARKKNRRIV